MCGKSMFSYFLERFRPPNPRDPRVSCESGGPPAPSPTARWEAYNCQKSKEENRTSSAKLTRTKNINYSWRKLILIFWIKKTSAFWKLYFFRKLEFSIFLFFLKIGNFMFFENRMCFFKKSKSIFCTNN